MLSASQDELLDAGPGEHLLERSSFRFHEAQQEIVGRHSTSTYRPFVLSQSGWTLPRPHGGTVDAMSNIWPRQDA